MSQTLFSLIVFVIVATITPGGATTLATASGTQFGFRRSGGGQSLRGGGRHRD